MTRPERARDLAKSPIYFLGGQTGASHYQIGQMPDLTTTKAAETGSAALRMARVKVEDVDIVQLYDAFTINVVMFLEDLGFCPKGEGGRYIGDGRIAPGGSLPVNTNGGGLSCVQPGMYGIFTLIEAVEQLRGQAGDRQVAGANVALCHGNGGLLAAQSTVVLGTAATV